MHFEPADLLARDATVRELLRPLTRFFTRPGVTEVVVNRPQEVFIEAGACWLREPAPELTHERCLSLATAIATYAEQEVSARRPILSAVLPDGQRAQIILPPAVDADQVAITIRQPGAAILSLADYVTQGAFGQFVWTPCNQQPEQANALSPQDRELIVCLQARDLAGFLAGAVRERKNIAVVGETGSGKTTLMKTLCQSIPIAERLLTIEDVRELQLPLHANRVHLLYSKGQQGVAQVTPSELIASAMRMKPDRVLLAELRGAEAFDFLKLLTTGHAGSITSFHAESCALAAERFVFMAKEHADAAIFDPPALKRLVTLTIDVIVHVTARVVSGADGTLRKERYVREVAFNPIGKRTVQLGREKALQP